MRGEIAKGAAWMVAFRMFDRSIGLVSTSVLARLLAPNDFGLVAMAMSVIAIIELLTAFGFGVALIQMQEPRSEHYDTAWTLSFLLAVLGGVVTALAAVPAANFYGDPRLGPVMWAIGASWCISSLENIGTVLFRRELNFGAEFRFLAAKRMVGFVVTLASALTIGTYWTLVIGTASARIAGVVLSYVMHDYRPRFSLACARELFGFSGWLLFNNLLTVAWSRLPHFYVGRVFGAKELGNYSVGAEVAQLAQTELIAPINRAMFPGYARLVSDPPLFRRTCLDATAAILLIALPVSVGIAMLAGPFVRLLLGAQWGEAVAIIQVLAVAGTATALTSNSMSIYLALGRPHLVTVVVLARLVVFLAALALTGTAYGLAGVAYAETASTTIGLLVALPITFAKAGIRLRQYLAVSWRPVVASTVMGWIVAAAVRPEFNSASSVSAAMQLLAGAAIGALTYPLLIAALWRIGRKPDAVELLLFTRGRDALKAWTARLRRS
jgi:O-antigen/teichoic acid export membrane protein